MKSVNNLWNPFWSILTAEHQVLKHLHSFRIVWMVTPLLELSSMWLVHNLDLTLSNEESDCSTPTAWHFDWLYSTKGLYHHHQDFDNNYDRWWMLRMHGKNFDLNLGLVRFLLRSSLVNPIVDKCSLIQFSILLPCMIPLCLRHMYRCTFSWMTK